MMAAPRIRLQHQLRTLVRLQLSGLCNLHIARTETASSRTEQKLKSSSEPEEKITEIKSATPHLPHNITRKSLKHSKINKMDTPSTQSQNLILSKSFSWIIKESPAFPINGAKVRVITDPGDFYNELLTKTMSASRRISLSSLYLGTGHLEEKLVTTMRDRCESCPDLRVSWLLDHTRGSRGSHNSRSMLQPLIADFPNTCKVSLYHTPKLRGFLRWLIPQRWNEIIGLQHMKLYVFDDSLLISGANLSNDYFTNRQDRYIVFDDCPALASFYHNIISTVANHSLQLNADDSETMPEGSNIHPFLGDKRKYIFAVKSSITELWKKECDKNASRLAAFQSQPSESSSNNPQVSEENGERIQELSMEGDRFSRQFSDYSTKPDTLLSDPQKHKDDKIQDKTDGQIDTIVFPTLQMAPFKIDNDSLVTQQFLETAESGSRIQLASGYLNLTDKYKKCITRNSEASYNILTAHPKANGFLGASGMAGAVPAVYTQLLKGFFTSIMYNGQEQRIKLYEYIRPEWTFHAKGLWYYRQNQILPSMTMIGSPNFGWRSVSRDLETQTLIFTRNKSLQSSLHQEQERLYNSALDVTVDSLSKSDRRVPLWVTMIMPIITVFF